MGQLCCKKRRYLETNSTDVNVPTVPTWKAVVSLALIFAVYVGVQVVRQAYPVLIPAGMRCYQNQTSACESASDSVTVNSFPIESMNESQASVDCIEFSDTQQAILTGLTLAFVYVLAAIPLARATEVGSHVFVLAVGQFFLAAMVVVTAVSQRFLVLWFARLGAGFGEAACSPTAYSLISDYFLAMNRAKALSFYHFATNVGVAIAYSLGLLNSYLCWRWVFYCLAITEGILFLLVVMFLREPPYDSSDSLLSSHDIYTIQEMFHRLIKNKPYLLLCSASSMRNISTYTLWAWLPTFYAKVLLIPSEEYGVNVALIVLCGGGLGCLISGVLTDRISRRRKQNKAYMIAVSQLTAAPLILGTLLTLSASSSFGLLFLACLAAEIAPGLLLVFSRYDLFAVNLRSKAFAVYIAVGNIVGGAVGPMLIVGIMWFRLSWHESDQGVGVALAIVVPTFYLLSSLLFAITGYLMPTDTALNEETIYLKYETSEVDPDSEADERETIFYGSLSL